MAIIEVFSLDIDVDAAVKSASNFKTTADSLKKQIDALKKAGDTSSETYVKLKGSLDEANSQYRTAQREVKNLTTLQKTGITTIEDGRKALSVLNAQWARSADLYGENSVETQKLAKETKELRDRLKEEEAAVGDTSRNVGNYTESIEKAFSNTSIFGEKVQTVTEFLGIFTGAFGALKDQAASAVGQITNSAKATEGLSKAQKVAAISTNIVSGALKLFRVALISTGIGAIVVLLGSLIAYFSGTQKGIDAVNSVLTPLKVVFESLVGVLETVGEALAGLFTADGITEFGNLIEELIIKKFEQFKKIATAIGKIITFDFKEGINDLKEVGGELVDELSAGFEKLKDISGELADTIAEAYDRGQQIADLQIQIENGEISLIKRRAELNLLTKEQNKIAEDVTRTDKERIAAAKEASLAQQELLKIEQQLLDDKIQKLKLEQQSNDTSREDQKELAQLEAERIEKATQNAEIQTTLQNKLNSIIQQRIAAAKKANEEEIKSLERQLEIFIERNRLAISGAEEQLEFQRELSRRDLEIQRERLDRKLISEEEYNLEVLKIRNALTEFEDDLREEELERIKDFENRKKDLQDEIRISREEDAQERAELEAELEFEKAVLELENLQLRENEKTELLLLLSEQREIALNAIKKNFQDKALDEFKKANDAELKIRKASAKESEQVAKQLTGILVGLLGDSIGAQLAGIAIDAIIEAGLVNITAAGAQARNLAAATATAPPPANLPFIAAAGVQNAKIQASATASTSKILAAAAIQGIGAVANKFRDGGLQEVGGQRHSAGGTKFYGEDGTVFEAERGELIGVMSRKASEHFMKFNNVFSGASSRKNYAAEGGLIQRGVTLSGAQGSSQAIDVDQLADVVISGVSSLPAPVVLVDDINTGQSNVAEVVDGANL